MYICAINKFYSFNIIVLWKKVFLRVQIFALIIKCKCWLRQLANFAGKDIRKFTPNDFLKIYNLLFKLYWIPFIVDVEDDDPYEGSFLLLEDWLYYLKNTIPTCEIHKRFTQERMDDHFVWLKEQYIADLKYELKKHHYEVADYAKQGFQTDYDEWEDEE